MNERDERLSAFVVALEERGSLSVEQLVSLFGTSPATVRRDLAALTRQRRIVRTRGGARVFRADEEAPIAVRDALARDAKRRIARTTAALLPRGRLAIAIGGGTTTSAFVEAIGGRTDITVVTNSLTIAQQASRLQMERVVVVGGFVRHESQELVGVFSEATLGALRVAYAILGAGGIATAGGVTTHDEAEARTNHAMIASARRTIIVADGTKVGHLALAPLASVTEINVLVTDESAPDDALEELRGAGVEIILAPNSPSPAPR